MGESYQLLRSPGISPHPEFECCQHYPVHLTEVNCEGMEKVKGVGMGAWSDQNLERPQHPPEWLTEGNCESVASEKGTGTDEEP